MNDAQLLFSQRGSEAAEGVSGQRTGLPHTCLGLSEVARGGSVGRCHQSKGSKRRCTAEAVAAFQAGEPGATVTTLPQSITLPDCKGLQHFILSSFSCEKMSPKYQQSDPTLKKRRRNKENKPQLVLCHFMKLVEASG